MSAGLSQQFCVRWNSHLGSLGAAFPQLLAGQRFVDVTLACEGHQVHCHRLVLAACSTYFENLLGENPCKHPIIILPRDIKLWEIQALVDFMYKGEVNVSQAGLPDLLKCAEILKIRGLCGSDAALNLNQITSSAASSAIVTGATPQNQTQPTSNVTETNTSMHNSGQNNNHSNNHTNNLTNPALAQSILSSRLNQLDTKPLSSSSMMKNNSLLNSLNLQPIAPSIRPQSLTGNFSSHGIGSVNTAAVKHVQPLTLLDDADNSDNGSGSEMCIKTEDLIIDEDVGKMKDEEEEDDVEMEANDKLQSEFAMANVTCEYDNGNMQLMDNSSGGRRVRRSEAILKQAADCVSRGETFQTVSDMFHIPISTIRFYMARKGILPRRKRGRTAILPFVLASGMNSTNVMVNNSLNVSNEQMPHNQMVLNPTNPQSHQNSSRSSSPSEPPFHFANYKLPELRPKLV